jgi:hypothetical protein
LGVGDAAIRNGFFSWTECDPGLHRELNYHVDVMSLRNVLFGELILEGGVKQHAIMASSRRRGELWIDLNCLMDDQKPTNSSDNGEGKRENEARVRPRGWRSAGRERNPRYGVIFVVGDE